MRVICKKPFFLSIIFIFFFSTVSFFWHPTTSFSSIAHRGASSYAPENTMSAFTKAVELGFDFIELDVRLSFDDELVVIHDPKVNRTTNGRGYVHELSTEELRALDAGSWFHSKFRGERIPLLSEVLEEYGGEIGILIELKSPNKDGKMSEILSSMLQTFFEKGLDPSTIKVQSFQFNEMKFFSNLRPDVSTGIIANRKLNLLHLATYRDYASFISIHHQFLSKSFVKQARQFDFEVFAWTIRQQKQFFIVQKYSVHGIISDLEKRETKFLATN